MTNKARLKKIEARIQPEQITRVVYEHPEGSGIYYDKSPWLEDKQQIDPEELKRFEQTPGAILFKIIYTNNWRKNRLPIDDDL